MMRMKRHRQHVALTEIHGPRRRVERNDALASVGLVDHEGSDCTLPKLYSLGPTPPRVFANYSAQFFSIGQDSTLFFPRRLAA